MAFDGKLAAEYEKVISYCLRLSDYNLRKKDYAQRVDNSILSQNF